MTKKRFQDLICPTPKGIYCPPGDFYIDPVSPVDRAVITHGHADHARAGHKAVLATPETIDIMATRYGETFTESRQSLALGETVTINGVCVSLAPAGHVLGSAQSILEYDGVRIVASGDYKRRPDPTCTPFEPISCDVFISEATFALPVFRHPDDRDEIEKLLKSVRQFPERTHLVGAYSLGKAQRVIRLIRNAGYDEAIYIHGAMKSLCALYERNGVDLGALESATLTNAAGEKQKFAGKIVVAPPSAFADKWARRFPDPVTCFASGWMGIRQRAKQRGVELPLVLSDHADWDELTTTIEEIGPQELWITHGRDDALSRWAELKGLTARPLSLIGYDDEGD
ncbi:MAG: ligase-associated DNA damage response exonuclease [Pseudomonadota bacterium]